MIIFSSCSRSLRRLLALPHSGEGQPLRHDDAESPAGMAADSWRNLVAEAEGAADLQRAGEVAGPERDDRRLAVDLHRDVQDGGASLGIPVK